MCFKVKSESVDSLKSFIQVEAVLLAQVSPDQAKRKLGEQFDDLFQARIISAQERKDLYDCLIGRVIDLQPPSNNSLGVEMSREELLFIIKKTAREIGWSSSLPISNPKDLISLASTQAKKSIGEQLLGVRDKLENYFLKGAVSVQEDLTIQLNYGYEEELLVPGGNQRSEDEVERIEHQFYSDFINGARSTNINLSFPQLGDLDACSFSPQTTEEGRLVLKAADLLAKKLVANPEDTESCILMRNNILYQCAQNPRNAFGFPKMEITAFIAVEYEREALKCVEVSSDVKITPIEVDGMVAFGKFHTSLKTELSVRYSAPASVQIREELADELLASDVSRIGGIKVNAEYDVEVIAPKSKTDDLAKVSNIKYSYTFK